MSNLNLIDFDFGPPTTNSNNKKVIQTKASVSNDLFGLFDNPPNQSSGNQINNNFFTNFDSKPSPSKPSNPFEESGNSTPNFFVFPSSNDIFFQNQDSSKEIKAAKIIQKFFRTRYFVHTVEKICKFFFLNEIIFISIIK